MNTDSPKTIQDAIAPLVTNDVVHPLHIISTQKLTTLNHSFTETEEKYQEYKNARNQVIQAKKDFNNVDSQNKELIHSNRNNLLSNEESLNFGNKGYVYISSANIFLRVDSNFATNLLDRCLVDLEEEKQNIKNEIESVLLDLRRFQTPS